MVRERIGQLARKVVNRLPDAVARPGLRLYVGAFHRGASPDARAFIVDRGQKALDAFLAEVRPGETVLDLGGYLGDFSAEAARRGARVHVCEPVPAFAARIRERLGGSVTVHEVGVSNRAGTIAMRVGGANTGEFRGDGDAVSVRLVRCSDLLRQEHMDEIALVMMNIEGAEYDVLPDLIESKLVQRVERLLVQFHPVDASAAEKRRQLRAQLSATHECVFSYEFIWEGWRRAT